MGSVHECVLMKRPEREGIQRDRRRDGHEAPEQGKVILSLLGKFVLPSLLRFGLDGLHLELSLGCSSLMSGRCVRRRILIPHHTSLSGV